MAIVALCGFVAAGMMGLRYLQVGPAVLRHDSHVDHLRRRRAADRIDLGARLVGTLVGLERAYARLVPDRLPAVLLYQPLRFSIEDPDRQARYAAVFSIVAGAFVPLNFIAVRLAQAYTHPRVLSVTGGNLPGSMRLTFVVSLTAVTMLYLTLRRLELTAKHSAFELRALRRRADGEASEREPSTGYPAAAPAVDEAALSAR